MKEIFIGCLCDRNMLERTINKADEAMHLLYKDQSLSFQDILKIFEEKNSELQIHMYKVDYEDVETEFFILGHIFSEIDRNKSLNEIYSLIESETFRFLGIHIKCDIHIIDEDEYY